MTWKQSESNAYTLRSGLILQPQHQEKIEEALANLMQQVQAPFVLVADVTGQVVTSRGQLNKVDLVALGSLVAGDLAASHEIARLTGQYQDYQMVLREGQTTHTFICEAGHHLALLAQISTQTPLGWARMVIRQTAQQLSEITSQQMAEAAAEDDASSAEALGQEDLPDLFNDALDELWLE